MCNATLPAALNPSQLLICVSACKKTHTVRDALQHACVCMHKSCSKLACHIPGISIWFYGLQTMLSQFWADDYGKQQKRGTRCFRHHGTSSPYIVKLPVHVARFTQKCISVLEACGMTEIQMQVHYYWLLGYELLVILACFNIFDSCWLYACGKALSNRL